MKEKLIFLGQYLEKRRLEKIRDRHLRAFNARMTPTQYLDWKNSFNQQLEVLSGKSPFNRQAYEQAVKKMQTNPTYLMFSNPPDFLLLQQFFTDSEFMKNYIHETEHFNKARELGFQKPMIGIFYADDEQGENHVQYLMHPGKIPIGMSDEQMPSALKEIISAPTSLSEGDKYILGQE